MMDQQFSSHLRKILHLNLEIEGLAHILLMRDSEDAVKLLIEKSIQLKKYASALTDVDEEYETRPQSNTVEKTENENEIKSESESESETENELESESENETELESETESESEGVSETEPESEDVSETESESEDVSRTESESENQLESESENGSVSESDLGKDNESESENESETTDPITDIAPVETPESVSKPDSESNEEKPSKNKEVKPVSDSDINEEYYPDTVVVYENDSESEQQNDDNISVSINIPTFSEATEKEENSRTLNTTETNNIPIPPVHDKSVRVDEMISRREARNLNRAFSVNDRFRFLRELFLNDVSNFNYCVSFLSQLESLDEAYDYLLNDLGWNVENETVKDFLTIVSNHFNGI